MFAKKICLMFLLTITAGSICACGQEKAGSEPATASEAEVGEEQEEPGDDESTDSGDADDVEQEEDAQEDAEEDAAEKVVTEPEESEEETKTENDAPAQEEKKKPEADAETQQPAQQESAQKPASFPQVPDGRYMLINCTAFTYSGDSVTFSGDLSSWSEENGEVTQHCENVTLPLRQGHRIVSPIPDGSTEEWQAEEFKKEAKRLAEQGLVNFDVQGGVITELAVVS